METHAGSQTISTAQHGITELGATWDHRAWINIGSHSPSWDHRAWINMGHTAQHGIIEVVSTWDHRACVKMGHTAQHGIIEVVSKWDHRTWINLEEEKNERVLGNKSTAQNDS